MEKGEIKLWWDEKEEVIRIKVIGSQDVKEARDFEKKLMSLVDELKNKGVKYIDGISDSTESGISSNADVRKVFAECLQNEIFKESRIAMFGLKGSVKMVVKFLLPLGGLSKNVKLFDTEKEALEWAWRLECGDTMFHIVNAYTRAAQLDGLPAESSYRLQRVGGNILCMLN